MPIPVAVITAVTPLVVKGIPALVQTAVDAYTKIRDRKKPKNPTTTANLQGLQERVANLEERADALEGSLESQADLIVELTKHNATLMRWILALTVFSVLSGGTAIAALLLAVL